MANRGFGKGEAARLRIESPVLRVDTSVTVQDVQPGGNGPPVYTVVDKHGNQFLAFRHELSRV